MFVRNEAGDPVQRILPVQPFALAYHDLSQLAEAEKEQARASLTEETLHRPFDLTQDVLIRASLVKLDEQDHVLNLCMHHIVSDGWSMGVLTRELAALYEAFSQGRENPLAELPIQYADYAQWQRQWLSGERLAQQVASGRRNWQGAVAAGTADGLSKAAGAELCRQHGAVRPGRSYYARTQCPGQAARGDAVHGAAGRVCGTAGQTERPG